MESIQQGFKNPNEVLPKRTTKKKEKVGIEKIFLAVSLFFGIIFSFIFPIFYEGDAQFHFDYSSYQANTVVNREVIGSNASFGYGQEFNAIKEGKYIQKYFQQKLELIPKEKILDKRAIRNKSLFNNITHFFPALGIFIGYHIYPSIGSMVVTARLIMVLIYSTAFYWIIKKVHYGKYLFFLTACTPVMMIEGFSLSYDSPSFILTAALLATQLNYIYRKTSSIFWVSLFSILVFFLAKENMKVVLLLSLLIIIDKFYKLDQLSIVLNKYKKILIATSIVIVVIGYILFSNSHGGFENFTFRMLNTLFSIQNEQYTRGVFLGILGDFTASYSLPWWCLYGYAITFFLAIFGEIKPKIAHLFSYVGGSLFFINLFGTTALYNTFSNSVRQPQDITQVIGGQLGRYYTSLLPTFTFFQNIFNFNLAIEEKILKKIVVLWTIFCLSLLLFITIYFCYVLKIPAPV